MPKTNSKNISNDVSFIVVCFANITLFLSFSFFYIRSSILDFSYTNTNMISTFLNNLDIFQFLATLIWNFLNT